MVKVFPKSFPRGSYKGQKTAGYYIDNFLQQNLDVCCKRVVNDMDFVFLISGSGMVRNGKSVLAQQIGYYLTYKTNQLHKIENTFTLDNVVFKAKDLIKKAKSLPKHSVIILDEGDDLTENYWSFLAKILRRFFRKCGQLNLFLVLLIPDFFELSPPFALTRSICLLNVYFYGNFQRGYFGFYDFEAKKQLYIKGRKYKNYKAWDSVFDGRFCHFYPLNEKEYRDKKWKDLQEDDKGAEIENRVMKKCWVQVVRQLDNLTKSLTQEQKSELLLISRTSIRRYEKAMEEEDELEIQ